MRMLLPLLEQAAAQEVRERHIGIWRIVWIQEPSRPSAKACLGVEEVPNSNLGGPTNLLS